MVLVTETYILKLLATTDLNPMVVLTISEASGVN